MTIFRVAVYVVAGAPGAGKTTVTGLLAPRLDPVPAVIDKDTVYGSFVAATLRVAGRPEGEREGVWYDEHVKVHEYGGMTATAAEIRSHGCPVMLVAPFTSQIRDPDVWRGWVSALAGDPVRLIWVGCRPEVLRARLVARASHRDGGKLDDFDAWTQRMLPATPPPIPHLAVDTGDGNLEQRVAEVAEQLLSR